MIPVQFWSMIWIWHLTKRLLWYLQFLIKEPASFKNLDGQKSINPMMTNRPRNFQNFFLIRIGFSDFLKMTVTVLSSYLFKWGPEVVKYKNSSNKFQSQINKKWNKFQDYFINICKTALNEKGSLKSENPRANNSLFMNKSILKTSMKGTILKITFENINLKQTIEFMFLVEIFVFVVRDAKNIFKTKNTLIILIIKSFY